LPRCSATALVACVTPEKRWCQAVSKGLLALAMAVAEARPDDATAMAKAVNSPPHGIIAEDTGKVYAESSVTRMHHITWTPKSDGFVEELWRTSTDGGQSCQ
jgi:hypothetical protein